MELCFLSFPGDESIERYTMDDLVQADWQRSYSLEHAVFPTSATRAAKFWPAVNRVDDAYGDRNFVCSCPPMSDYESEE